MARGSIFRRQGGYAIRIDLGPDPASGKRRQYNKQGFTGRFGPGTSEVLFDRICRENGIRHILTAPRSPTTTGKVERFHRTLKDELVRGVGFDSITDPNLSGVASNPWSQGRAERVFPLHLDFGDFASPRSHEERWLGWLKC